MTVQLMTTHQIHPQWATSESHERELKTQFIELCEEMKRRDGDRVKDVVMTLLPWIKEGDWEYPIQAMQSQLEAIDCRADMDEQTAMRMGA